MSSRPIDRPFGARSVPSYPAASRARRPYLRQIEATREEAKQVLAEGRAAKLQAEMLILQGKYGQALHVFNQYEALEHRAEMLEARLWDLEEACNNAIWEMPVAEA